MNRFFFFYLLITLCSCSLLSRKDQATVRGHFIQKDFDSAIKYIESSSLKKDEKNLLLYYLEKGTIEFYQKKYLESSLTFENANKLIEKLYTKSVKEAIASSIVNDNSKSYYGAIYERSLIYYYQAQAFKELSLTNSKYKDQLRAILLRWNSFFDEVKRADYKSFQKHDVFYKLMASEMHMFLNTKRDLEISYILLQDALKIAKNVAPIFPVYNENYIAYGKALRSKKSTKNLLEPTKAYEKLIEHIKISILTYAKKYRPNDYRRFSRRWKEKRTYDDKTIVLIEYKHINGLEPKNFAINLNSVLKDVKDPSSRAMIEGIGVSALTYFAMGPIGLGYVSQHGNVSIYGNHHLGNEVTKEVGIEFEIPSVKKPNYNKNFQLIAIDENNKEKKYPIDYKASFSDLSYIQSEEIIANNFNQRASRVGVKYVLALLAAYSTYKSMEEKNPLFANAAAMTQFLISQKAIKETEKADTRHWSTLPGIMLRSSLDLKPGNYSLVLEVSELNAPEIKRINLGKLELKSNERSLFTYRAF